MARPRQPQAATAIKNVATHAGTRRSEARVMPRYVDPMAAQRESDEDPRYPGFKTTLVPIKDSADPNGISPVDMFEGLGYSVISKDPKFTQMGGHVLMGIDIDIYLERERQRVESHNAQLTELIDGSTDGLPTKPGDDGVWFDRGASSLERQGQTTIGEVVSGLAASEANG